MDSLIKDLQDAAKELTKTAENASDLLCRAADELGKSEEGLTPEQKELLEKFKIAFFSEALEPKKSKKPATKKKASPKAEAKDAPVDKPDTIEKKDDDDLVSFEDFDDDDAAPVKPKIDINVTDLEDDDFFTESDTKEYTEEMLREIRVDARNRLQKLTGKHGFQHKDIVALLAKHNIESFIKAELSIMPDLLGGIKELEKKLG